MRKGAAACLFWCVFRCATFGGHAYGRLCRHSGCARKGVPRAAGGADSAHSPYILEPFIDACHCMDALSVRYVIRCCDQARACGSNFRNLNIGRTVYVQREPHRPLTKLLRAVHVTGK